MKKTLYTLLSGALMLGATSCIEEINPESSTVTIDQAANVTGGYDNFVSAITSTLSGSFNYWPAKQFPYDYGYTSFYLCRDVMGQDITITNSGSWYQTWGYVDTGLGPRYAVCQFPWTVFYSWIKSCNTVIQIAGEEPSSEHIDGAGIAYAMRALFYLDLARTYAQKSYGQDPEAITVPIVTESTNLEDLAYNPRATNRDMFAFILSDLDKAETYLANYNRADVYTPNLSVVYGLKARAYQWMEDWVNAEKYAKLAQNGYTMMSQAQYMDRDLGFNSPNAAWMLGTRFKSDNDCILENDADCSWGSQMLTDMFHLGGTGCGYAANYGYPFAIDRHLYNTIPATDFRKDLFIDFSIADMDDDEAVELCEKYSDYPEELAQIPGSDEYEYGIGGVSVKFRPNGGSAGRANQYVGFLVSVPMMRVEEMKLIEIEAAGMQNESNGIAMLTEFAKTRDPQFVYGQHNEAYYNTATSAFQNEIWWQRRVELWGEGFSMYDIKRLGKGIIRSYEGTNHLDQYQWNVEKTPDWMSWCIGGTEPTYNYELVQNPLPVKPQGNSPKFTF